MALVAHLGGDLRLTGGLGQGAGFVNRVGERLLDIDVFAGANGRHGDHCVGVVGRGDDDGVNVLLLVKHFAVVAKHSCLWVFLERLSGVVLVHVAKGHDVLRGARSDVVPSHASDTDACDVESFAGRLLSRHGADHRAGHNTEGRGGQGSGAQELAACSLQAGRLADPNGRLVGVHAASCKADSERFQA